MAGDQCRRRSPSRRSRRPGRCRRCNSFRRFPSRNAAAIPATNEADRERGQPPSRRARRRPPTARRPPEPRTGSGGVRTAARRARRWPARRTRGSWSARPTPAAPVRRRSRPWTPRARRRDQQVEPEPPRDLGDRAHAGERTPRPARAASYPGRRRDRPRARARLRLRDDDTRRAVVLASSRPHRKGRLMEPPTTRRFSTDPDRRAGPDRSGAGGTGLPSLLLRLERGLGAAGGARRPADAASVHLRARSRGATPPTAARWSCPRTGMTRTRG